MSVTSVESISKGFTLARRSTDPQVRLKAVDRLSPWGGTALYDAILTAIGAVVPRDEHNALLRWVLPQIAARRASPPDRIRVVFDSRSWLILSQQTIKQL